MGLNNENASSAITQRPYLVFDIETAPMPDVEEYLTDPIEAPSNYKDEAKIKAYIVEKRAKQIAEAGLDLDLCEIVAIGLQDEDDRYARSRTRAESSEQSLLSEFWASAATTQQLHGVLVGFNALAFDLPILLRRSLYLGVPTPKLQIDKYRHDGIIDVAHELTYSGRMTWRSLAFYARRFGIPHDDSVKGEDIAGLVAAGAWDQIAQHVRADVETTAALAQRIGLIHQVPVVAEVA